MELYAVLIRGSLRVQKRLYEMCYIYGWAVLTSKDKRQINLFLVLTEDKIANVHGHECMCLCTTRRRN